MSNRITAQSYEVQPGSCGYIDELSTADMKKVRRANTALQEKVNDNAVSVSRGERTCIDNDGSIFFEQYDYTPDVGLESYTHKVSCNESGDCTSMVTHKTYEDRPSQPVGRVLVNTQLHTIKFSTKPPKIK